MRFFILTALFILSAHAAQEAQSPPSASKSEGEQKFAGRWNLPLHYTHKPAQAQLADYRKIYDPFFKKNGVSFTTTHIPGLFTIVSNAFALAAHFINNNQFVTTVRAKDGSLKNIEKRKEGHLDLLEKLYGITKLLEDEKRMTQYHFLMINTLLAIIIDEYKGLKLTNYSSEPRSREDAEEDQGILNESESDSLIQSQSETLDYIQKTEASHIFTVPEIENLFIQSEFPPDWTFHRNRKGQITDERFSPPAIIYLNRSGIATTTFVDQILGYDYSLTPLLFKSESFPIMRPLTQNEQEQFKKVKPAHYGIFNGTYNLLGHDTSHTTEQYRMERLFKEIGLDWHAHLADINDLRLLYKKTDPSSSMYHILTNGLFLLSHELHNITQGLLIDENGKLSQEYKDMLLDKDGNPSFHEALVLIKEIMASIFQPKEGFKLSRDSIAYREDYLNHEYILKGFKDLEDEPYLPSHFKDSVPKDIYEKMGNEIARDLKNGLKIHKEELIADGYERFWEDFITIVKADEDGAALSSDDEG